MATGAGVLFAAFFILWLDASRRKDASLVDAGWALGFGFMVWVMAFSVEGILWRRIMVALVAGAWALRLGWYIISRHRQSEHEDKRYQLLRRHWGAQANFKFLFFFLGQGLADLILALPLVLLFMNPLHVFSLWDGLGLALFVVALGGSYTADRQLSAWKGRRQNKGKTCRQGLWRYSRHPNYFFEWLHWCVYPVIGLGLLGTPMQYYWPILLVPPFLMLYLLLKVTGIPPAEKQALQSRGEDYRRYQQTTSAFFPWFPKQ